MGELHISKLRRQEHRIIARAHTVHSMKRGRAKRAQQRAVLAKAKRIDNSLNTACYTRRVARGVMRGSKVGVRRSISAWKVKHSGKYKRKKRKLFALAARVRGMANGQRKKAAVKQLMSATKRMEKSFYSKRDMRVVKRAEKRLIKTAFRLRKMPNSARKRRRVRKMATKARRLRKRYWKVYAKRYKRGKKARLSTRRTSRAVLGTSISALKKQEARLVRNAFKVHAMKNSSKKRRKSAKIKAQAHRVEKALNKAYKRQWGSSRSGTISRLKQKEHKLVQNAYKVHGMKK